MLTRYADDHAGWVEDTAKAIEDGRFDQIDRVALANEVRDLAITERTRIDSALRVLLMHLLKTKYQPEKQTRSWEATIRVQQSTWPSFSGRVRACAANCPNFWKTPTKTRGSRLRTKPAWTSIRFPKPASGQWPKLWERSEMAIITTDRAWIRTAKEVENALASVRLEGLEPSQEAYAMFQRYVEGEITSTELDSAFDMYFDRKYRPVRLPGNDRP